MFALLNGQRKRNERIALLISPFLAVIKVSSGVTTSILQRSTLAA